MDNNLIDIAVRAILLATLIYTFTHFKSDGMILEWYQKTICKLPKWLHKPLGGCMYCVNVWAFVLLNSYYLFSYHDVIKAFLLLLIGISIGNLYLRVLYFYLADDEFGGSC